MWIKLGSTALINLNNVAEIVWEQYGEGTGLFGLIVFLNTEGEEIDRVELRTKAEYDSAVKKITQLVTGAI